MISLILIYGPPGVGKTTLKQNLNEHISSNSKNNSSICLSISYDELIDKNLENMIINESNEQQQQQQQQAWKESRSFILKLITLLIDYLKQQQEKQEKNYYFNIFDDKERTSSSLYLKIIQDKFNNLMFSQLNTNAIIKHENFYILLDDLFYYSSMRLSFYRLACSKQCSYFSIGLIASNINILLERNETRSHSQRLPIHIIENIFKKLETNKNNWEFNFTHLIEINNNYQNLTDLFDLIEIGLNKFQIYLKNQQIKEEAEAEQQQQQKSENNFIHECDLKLRKLISLKLTNSSQDKKNLALKLNLLKSNILNELKTKQIKLDHLNELEIENYLNEKMSS